VKVRFVYGRSSRLGLFTCDVTWQTGRLTTDVDSKWFTLKSSWLCEVSGQLYMLKLINGMKILCTTSCRGLEKTLGNFRA